MARLRMVLLLLVATPFLMRADEPVKPRCSSQIRSMFWPPEANHDPQAAARLAREGTLEICTRTSFRFHWESMTLNAKRPVGQQGEKAGAEGSGARETVDAGGGGTR